MLEAFLISELLRDVAAGGLVVRFNRCVAKHPIERFKQLRNDSDEWPEVFSIVGCMYEDMELNLFEDFAQVYLCEEIQNIGNCDLEIALKNSSIHHYCGDHQCHAHLVLLPVLDDRKP